MATAMLVSEHTALLLPPVKPPPVHRAVFCCPACAAMVRHGQVRVPGYLTCGQCGRSFVANAKAARFRMALWISFGLVLTPIGAAFTLRTLHVRQCCLPFRLPPARGPC